MKDRCYGCIDLTRECAYIGVDEFDCPCSICLIKCMCGKPCYLLMNAVIAFGDKLKNINRYNK